MPGGTPGRQGMAAGAPIGAAPTGMPSSPLSPGATPNQSGTAGIMPPTMVGSGPAMQRLRAQLSAIAPRDTTVLINGESGSGKELTARTIHSHSKRATGPFVAVDCTGLRDTLLESQLFGHVKGAFTGADSPSIGFIRAAEGGTLFLDEIGELEIRTQAKLLRVIQERCVVPLGSTKSIHVNVRLVCATHRDLSAMAARGEFREDLLFRLDVVKLQLPALRQRPEDICSLASHFLHQLAELYGESVKALAPSAIEAIQTYHWPGNVRELANAIEHAVVFAQGDVIELADLPERVREGALVNRAGPLIQSAGSTAPVTSMPLTNVGIAGLGSESDGPVLTLDEAERIAIARALRATGGNQSRAAALLNIERRRLYRKVARYGLRDLTQHDVCDEDL